MDEYCESWNSCLWKNSQKLVYVCSLISWIYVSILHLALWFLLCNKSSNCLQVCSLWRLHRYIHLLLLHLLLPRPVRHVRLHADIVLLRLHDLCLLRLLPHAGHRWLPHIALLRAAHLPLHQVRVSPWPQLGTLAPSMAVAGGASEPNGETITGSIVPEFSAPLWTSCSSVSLLTFLSVYLAAPRKEDVV